MSRRGTVATLFDVGLLTESQANSLADSGSLASGVSVTQGSAVADAAVVTTVGANTGTAGAGLSLIGDTSTTNQAAALMNDLVALQEDILDIRTQLNALLGQLRAAGVIAT